MKDMCFLPWPTGLVESYATRDGVFAAFIEAQFPGGGIRKSVRRLESSDVIRNWRQGQAISLPSSCGSVGAPFIPGMPRHLARRADR